MIIKNYFMVSYFDVFYGGFCTVTVSPAIRKKEKLARQKKTISEKSLVLPD